MIKGVRRAQAGQLADSAVVSWKVMINVMNIMNAVNDEWGPPGPGKAVWGLCRNDSGRMRTVECLYGANPPRNGVRWAQGGQCGDSAGMRGNAMINIMNIINVINIIGIINDK